jgi:predicted N-acetyltransferase YhbS
MNFSSFNPADAAAIQKLFTTVFSDSEGQSEGTLIGNLVLDMMNITPPRDIYGFVATEQKQIIGGVFFTRLSFETSVEAFILSPIAVQTQYQGKGIGQKLINFGLDRLREKGVKLVFTYGDPLFYAKVGFLHITENVVKAPLKLTHPEGWLGQSLDDCGIEPIPGNSVCVRPLNNPQYW